MGQGKCRNLVSGNLRFLVKLMKVRKFLLRGVPVLILSVVPVVVLVEANVLQKWLLKIVASKMSVTSQGIFVSFVFHSNYDDCEVVTNFAL